MALSGSDAELPRTAAGRPSITMISGVLGRAVQPSDDLGEAHWRRLAGAAAPRQFCIESLADTGVDLVVVIGAAADPVEALWPRDKQTVRPATFVEAMGGSGGPDSDTAGGFAEAVAKAYRAGAPIAFAGLFAARPDAGSHCQAILPAPELLGPARKSVAASPNPYPNQ